MGAPAAPRPAGVHTPGWGLWAPYIQTRCRLHYFGVDGGACALQVGGTPKRTALGTAPARPMTHLPHVLCSGKLQRGCQDTLDVCPQLVPAPGHTFYLSHTHMSAAYQHGSEFHSSSQGRASMRQVICWISFRG